GRRGVPSGSAGRARAAVAPPCGLAGGAALRVHRRHAVAAVRLRTQRGVSGRPPRQRDAVEVPDRAAPQPRRLGSVRRTARHALVRAGRARYGAADPRRVRAPGPARGAPPTAARRVAPAGRRTGAVRRAPGGRRRFQRLAAQRGRDPGTLRTARSVRGRAPAPRPHVPRALAGAVARPHLCARRALGAAARAVGAAVVAPFRPRAAAGRGAGMNRGWIPGNRVRLLENGDAFFPRVMAAIDAAREDVLVETFILFDDEVGRRLHAALCAAARRGVRVALTLDGYGSPDLPTGFTGPLVEAGVRLRYFDPKRRLLGLRTNLFRRLHRKIVVVDARTAFVGGINFCAEQLSGFGEDAKQDYTIEVEGPAAAVIHAFARAALLATDAPRGWERVSGSAR